MLPLHLRFTKTVVTGLAVWVSLFGGLLPPLNAQAAEKSPAESREALLDKMIQGPPASMGTQLDPTDFVTMKLQRLTHAPTLYVNFDKLREKGIPVPRAGLTPEFREQLSRSWGWGVKTPGEPDAAFQPEFRDSYVAFYEGSFTGGNIGGGRATEGREVEFKQMGPTPMVMRDLSEGHSNGLGHLVETMTEAFYGEVNDHDLPHGGNRVVAIMDRGTGLKYEYGGVMAMLAREPSVRPAHYFPTPLNEKTIKRLELIRPERLAPRDPQVFARELAAGLPVPEKLRALPLATQIGFGLRTYAERIAHQYGAAFPKRIEHGSVSESNIEISGRFIDYGTESLSPDFGKALGVSWNPPAGDPSKTKGLLIDKFVKMLRTRLPDEVKAELPSVPELNRAFDEAYASTVRRGFAELSGIPPGVLDKLPGKDVSALGDAIWKTAVDGAESYTIWFRQSRRHTRYDIAAILRSLSDAKVQDLDAINSILKEQMTGPGNAQLRRSLSKAYAEAMKGAVAQAEKDGVAVQPFWKLVQQGAKIRTAARPEGYQFNVQEANERAIERYLAGDANAIQDSIEERLDRVKNIVPDQDPYKLILRRFRNSAQDSHLDMLYDARKDANFIRGDFAVDEGRVWTVRDSVPLDRMGDPKVSVNGTQSELEIASGRARFTAPIATAEISSAHIDILGVDAARKVTRHPLTLRKNGEGHLVLERPPTGARLPGACEVLFQGHTVAP